MQHIESRSRNVASAYWMPPTEIRQRFAYQPGSFWFGRDVSGNDEPLGYDDDRHVCLVSGNGGGKGTSVILPNLLSWPGSLFVIDPKGENATIAATRRANGSDKATGLGQRTFVLDPFKDARVPDEYRASFNPLDTIDPSAPDAVDEAARIADSIVVTGESQDPHWEESARALIKTLILHVLTFGGFEGRRTLSTVRALLLEGDQIMIAKMRERGTENIPSSQVVLWDMVRRNRAMGGLVSRSGEAFFDLAKHNAKEYGSIRSVAIRNTEFIDSPAMQDVLNKSDFRLSDLKTSENGVSVFLTLPQRYMSTHFRWLRMMTSLAVTEMEKTKGQPRSGHRILMCLDEFAGLKRMEVIENAVAQIRGYGMRLFFVLQSLEQLKAVYPERWETFLANASLKLFFNIEDNFTREYVSKHIGEEEVIRSTRTQSRSEGSQTSSAQGYTSGQSSSTTSGHSEGVSESTSRSRGHGRNRGSNSGAARGNLFNPGELVADTITNAFGGNRTRTSGYNQQSGIARSRGSNQSSSSSQSHSENTSESRTETSGENSSQSAGLNETVHKRALVTPDEIGRVFGRISDPNHPAYPGLGLALIAGEPPVTVRRSNYYEDPNFIGLFEPHPDYPFVEARTTPRLSKPIEPQTPRYDEFQTRDPDGEKGRREFYAREKDGRPWEVSVKRRVPFSAELVSFFMHQTQYFKAWLFNGHDAKHILRALPETFGPGTCFGVAHDIDEYIGQHPHQHFVIKGDGRTFLSFCCRDYFRISISIYDAQTTDVQLTAFGFHERPTGNAVRLLEGVGRTLFSKQTQEMKDEFEAFVRGETEQALKRFENMLYSVSIYGYPVGHMRLAKWFGQSVFSPSWLTWNSFGGQLNYFEDTEGNSLVQEGGTIPSSERIGYVRLDDERYSDEDCRRDYYLNGAAGDTIHHIKFFDGDWIDTSEDILLSSKISTPPPRVPVGTRGVLDPTLFHAPENLGNRDFDVEWVVTPGNYVEAGDVIGHLIKRYGKDRLGHSITAPCSGILTEFQATYGHEPGNPIGAILRFPFPPESRSRPEGVRPKQDALDQEGTCAGRNSQRDTPTTATGDGQSDAPDEQPKTSVEDYVITLEGYKGITLEGYKGTSLRDKPTTPEQIALVNRLTSTRESEITVEESVILAEMGCHICCYLLGQIYEMGKIVEQNYDLSFVWYMEGAELHDSHCQFKVGGYYILGKGCRKSVTDGILWLKTSAKQGNDLAFTLLGYVYSEREYSVVDFGDAAKWYEKAVSKKNALAMRCLASLLTKAPWPLQFDEDRAAELLRESDGLGEEGAREQLEELVRAQTEQRFCVQIISFGSQPDLVRDHLYGATDLRAFRSLRDIPSPPFVASGRMTEQAAEFATVKLGVLGAFAIVADFDAAVSKSA